jgi:hypothetical protein
VHHLRPILVVVASATAAVAVVVVAVAPRHLLVAPPGLHPSYTHPWAGTVQMWPYNRFGRPPMDPSAFTTIPQFSDNFCSNPGGAYGPHLLSTGELHLHHRYY